ncbi:MAG: hypothetical protein NVSMB52_17450 [Chloroflexota bacterium]
MVHRMPEVIEIHDIAAERAMVLRFCTRYTGNANVAEDLAQQTLLRAWQYQNQLNDRQARQSWLLSIAGNVCASWGRTRGRELAHRPWQGGTHEEKFEDQFHDDFDLEVEIERGELAELLDGALRQLHPETRRILIWRYIEQSSQAELADRLRISEGAVEARLHRGKLGLKKVLTTRFSKEAVSFGLITPQEAGWEETRIWCPGCGAVRLEGRFRPEEGELYMRCPKCSPPGTQYIGSHLGSKFKGLRTYKPAISRVLETIHHLFRVMPVNGSVRCAGCQRWLPIQRAAYPFSSQSSSGYENIYVACAHCSWADYETWHSLSWSVPQVQEFWKRHPRMRFVPERSIKFDGRASVLTGFESVTSAARLEVVFLRDTYEVLHVAGAPTPCTYTD